MNYLTTIASEKLLNLKLTMSDGSTILWRAALATFPTMPTSLLEA